MKEQQKSKSCFTKKQYYLNQQASRSGCSIAVLCKVSSLMEHIQIGNIKQQKCSCPSLLLPKRLKKFKLLVQSIYCSVASSLFSHLLGFFPHLSLGPNLSVSFFFPLEGKLHPSLLWLSRMAESVSVYRQFPLISGSFLSVWWDQCLD